MIVDANDATQWESAMSSLTSCRLLVIWSIPFKFSNLWTPCHDWYTLKRNELRLLHLISCVSDGTGLEEVMGLYSVRYASDYPPKRRTNEIEISALRFDSMWYYPYNHKKAWVLTWNHEFVPMIIRLPRRPSEKNLTTTALLSLTYSFCPRGIEMSKGKREASPEKETRFGIKIFTTCLSVASLTHRRHFESSEPETLAIRSESPCSRRSNI